MPSLCWGCSGSSLEMGLWGSSVVARPGCRLHACSSGGACHSADGPCVMFQPQIAAVTAGNLGCGNIVCVC